MRKRMFVAAALAVSIMALVLVFGLVVMPSSTNTAYAAELAQRSYQAIVTLPPDQQGELVHRLQISDPKALLQEAKNAKDLKVLTYDQFISQHPVPPDATLPDGKGPDLRSLTFLQFTDTNGSKVVLGIDKNTNLPAIVSLSFGSQGSNSVSTHGGAMRFVVTPSEGMQSQGSNSVSSDGGGKSESFQSVVGNTRVEGTISADGTGTFIVNGKKYTAPAGTKFSTDKAPSVTVEGNDVFVDGIKLTPEN